ncbi:hypothetical protein BT69DRAFT_1294511 [Atractiella rhizophila]|nr:hypothetical protein BT69DRAFT_1294511 [Atractiella rhizophila]
MVIQEMRKMLRLGKMIYALQPAQTRQQMNNARLTGMLECLSEVHRSANDDGCSSWNRAQSGGVQDMASASNINVSFLEVKKKGAVLEKDFQEVQDVLEAWAKKSAHYRQRTNT